MKVKLFIVYLFEFLRDGFYVGLFILLPFIVKDLHLNLFQAGSLQTLISILIIALAAPITYLLIRFGELRLLLSSLLLYAICFASIFFGNSYNNLFVIFFVLGIAFAIYTLVSSHIRLTWFNKESRGKELGNLIAIGDVGKVLSAISVGFLVGVIGWRSVSLAIGIVACIAFFTVFIILKKSNVTKQEREKIVVQSTNSSFRYLITHKRFLLALLVNCLDDGVNTPFYAFLPFLLLYKGVPIIFLGMFTGFYYMGNIVSRLIFGRLVDKIGNVRVLILLDVTMAIVTILLVISPSLIITGFLALLLGFITEGTDPATTSMVAESIEHIERPERASTIRVSANGITRALFPFLLGAVASVFGIAWGFYGLALASLLPIIPAMLFSINKRNYSV